MNTINLNLKTKALEGTIKSRWFENKNIGLERTLFHEISIPLEPFNSGLEYEHQPVVTEIVFDWYALNLENPSDLDGLNLTHENYPKAEASVCIGDAHNWCNVIELKLQKIRENLFNVSGKLTIEFENEGVAENEYFEFCVSASYQNA